MRPVRNPGVVAIVGYRGVMTTSPAIPRLRITGLVARPAELTLDRVRALAGNRDTVPVANLLAQAGPDPAARYVTFISDDGAYRACVPLADARDKGVLQVGTGPEGLAAEAGGPVRLIIEDGDTLCWNVKAVAELHCAPDKEPDSVPENPPH